MSTITASSLLRGIANGHVGFAKRPRISRQARAIKFVLRIDTRAIVLARVRFAFVEVFLAIQACGAIFRQYFRIAATFKCTTYAFYSPTYPSGHVQLYSAIPSMQVPPFLHGDDQHSSQLVWHCIPVYPSMQ